MPVEWLLKLRALFVPDFLPDLAVIITGHRSRKQ